MPRWHDAADLREVFARPPDLQPWHCLALAVLQQAVADARSSHPLIRKRATLWLLRGDQGLEFWCHVAGLNREYVLARGRRELRLKPDAPDAPAA